VPGETPHPRRDPGGHSYGISEPASGPWDPDQWRELDLWLHAIDLFNLEYWWECHEALEGLWHAAGRKTPQASFVQGLLQVAAAHLNRRRGKPNAATQAERGLSRMAAVSRGVYMGIDVASFTRAVRTAMHGSGPPAHIVLENER
jgi:hypothetical protein